MRISTVARLVSLHLIVSLFFGLPLIAQESSDLEKAWSLINVAPAPVQAIKDNPIMRFPSVVSSPSLPLQVSPDIEITAPLTNTTQSENSVAVHPLNNNLLLVSNNSGDFPVTTIYGADSWISTNGGLNWSGSVQGAGGTNRGDPAAAIARNGRFYIGYIAANSGNGAAYSTNNGTLWTHVQVYPNPGSLADKNHLWVDISQTSPYVNNVYASWTDFGGANNNRIVFKRSTDGGLTWPGTGINLSSAVGGGSHDQGVNIASGPNGEVYAAWAIYDSWPSLETAIGFAKSTNGGATFAPATRIITNIRGIRSQGAGGGLLGGKDMRTASFPSMAVNMQNGNIYIVWTNIGVPGVNTGTERDVWMSKSTNGGATWSTAVRVNQDAPNNGKDQWFPWISCDPTTGILAVTFYDSRDFAANDMAHTYVAVSYNDGVTWEDFRVSDVAWSGDGSGTGYSGNYAGDYIGVTILNGKVYPVWTDRRSAGARLSTWISPVQLAVNFGWAKGVVSSSGNPVSGVDIDFVEPQIQVPGTSDANGNYRAGATVDTTVGWSLYTIRARKFGYLTFTDTITLRLADTVTRNINITPAAGGTLLVRSLRSDSSGIRSNVRVLFGGNEVVNGFTDSTTGNFSTPLPTGTYDVIVDPPSPFGTRRFSGVVINASQTTTVVAIVRPVVTHAPAAMRDTLAVGQTHTKNLALTNTTTDSVPWRLSTEAITFQNLTPEEREAIERSKQIQPSYNLPKGAIDTHRGWASPAGRGGPDAFGYVWIDSDEPGGPQFNWVDITGVGTQITGLGDDTNLGPFPIGFNFSFYGNTYNQILVCSNGWFSFTSTSTSYSNTAIPTTAEPNNALYTFWDDLNFSSGGTAHYYYDAANNRFIIQYTNVPYFSGTGTCTFQVILKPSGEMVYQYLSMTGLLTSATIGIENATGTIALQVVFDSAYVHNNLAILFKLRGVDWLSYSPSAGVLAPSGNQDVTATFNATGLTAGTTYNANTYLDVTHPDVTGSIIIPSSLRVQPADSALLIVSKDSIIFPTTPVNGTRRDSLTARNGGALTLNISSISSTNPRFTVTPSSATIPPGDSIRIRVTYAPLAEGTDTGRIIILSNSQGQPRKDIRLRGTAIGMPILVAHRDGEPMDSLVKTMAGGSRDSILFHVLNVGTGFANFAARAIMYPRTVAAGSTAEPIIIPMKVRSEWITPSVAGRGDVPQNVDPRIASDNPAANGTTPVFGTSSSQTADRSPFKAQNFSVPQNPLDQFDLQFDYNAQTVTGALGNAGAIFIPTLNEFWTSRWASNVLHRWNANGTLIEQFTIAGVTGVRGLTYDGQFLYASANSATIYKIDPVTRTLVGTITCPTGVTARMIAYDPIRDGFWVSNWATVMTCVSRTGTTLATMANTLVAKYGAAYDRYTAGGPYLWVWDQTNTAGGIPQPIYQFNLTTLTYTGFSFDILTRVTTGGATPIAGGLFIATGLVPGKATIGGMLQGAPDRLWGLELADAVSGAPWLAIRPTSGTLAVADSVLMVATFDATDPTIYENPGNYFGRVEVNATNSPLADTLRVPVRMFVQPADTGILVVRPDSLNFDTVAIGSNRTLSFRVQNIGGRPVNVTNINITNPNFTASPTSFTLASLETLRVNVTFNAPAPEAQYTGTLSFVSNAASAQTVRLVGTSLGVPVWAVRVDSLTRTLQRGSRDSILFYMRNAGTGSGAFAARAIMFPRTAASGSSAQPIIVPMEIKPVFVAGRLDYPRGTSSPSLGPALRSVHTTDAGVQESIVNTFSLQGFKAYGINLLGTPANNLVKFDLTAPGTLVTQGLSVQAYAGDFDITGTFLWGIRQTVPISLIRVDSSNGSVIVIGPTTPLTGETWTALTVDPATGTLYASSTNITRSTLYTVNPSNGTATVVGQITNVPSIIAMSADNTGQLYGYALNDNFYSINKVTAAGTLIGPIGFDANYAQDMDFDPATNTCYLAAYNNALGRAELRIANVNTGATTLVGPIGAGSGVEIDCFGISGRASGVANWLGIRPPSGTLAVGDSVLMVATFDATDPTIYGNPGNYYGRVEVAATNSPLADTLRIPVRMFVQPDTAGILVSEPDSLNFGSVEIDSSRTLSFRARNIGARTVTVTNLTITNPNFTATPTSFTLAFLDTQRVNVTFTAPSPGALHTGILNYVSNAASAQPVRLVARSLGIAHIVAQPDTFYRNLPPTADTTRTNFTIRNTGTDTLRYTIQELPGPRPGPGANPIPPTIYEGYELPKGAVDPRPGIPPMRVNGRGGPDSAGYTWIDSDEPGGPQFNWVDIRSVATPLIMDDDQNLGPFPMGFNFSFYGNTYDQIRVCSNGFLSFTSTSTVYTNTAIPTTTEPNNALYPFWDDLNPAATGRRDTIYYYADAANQRFIVQYQNVRHYGTTEPGEYTFQAILRADGSMLFQYLQMLQTLNSATIGIENATGTIALQVVYNAPYMHNNLAILISRDVAWLSTDRTAGTIAPADSQRVELRYHPAGMAGGSYDAHLRISGNSPDVRNVAVHLDVIGQPTITVTSPNGGERWVRGRSYNITWTRVQLDTVKIEYSITGSGGPWRLITDGVPARPGQTIHSKLNGKYVEGGIVDNLFGTFPWTIPDTVTPSTNCYVKVSWKAFPDSVFDRSDNAFSILTVLPETTWTVQTSGTSAILYSVKTVNDNVAWAGGAGGIVVRTINAGTNWNPADTLGIDIYTITAFDANIAMAGTYGDGFARIWKTTNGGVSWRTVDSVAGGFPNYVHMFDANNAYWQGDPVGTPSTWELRRTTNGGQTWFNADTLLATPPTEAGWNNSMMWFGTNNGWFGTNSTHIYRTTDGGSTWTAVPNSFANSYAVWFNRLNLGLAGASTGAVDRSTNAGASWSPATAITGATISGMSGVLGAASSEFWASVFGGSVYYSPDGGTAWTTAPPHGYAGTIALRHVDMVTVESNVYGWAAGSTGRIVRYRRVGPVAVDAEAELPTVFALDQNYPNPFNPATTIKYALPVEATVTLKVYNILGQEIATLVNETQKAGYYNTVWDGRNNSGAQIATGIYFFRINAAPINGGNTFTQIKKMVLMK